MPSSRFLYIPTAGSGGGGGDQTASIDGSEVRLTVLHPVVNYGVYFSIHSYTWLCTFNGNFTEVGSGIDYTEWRRPVGVNEVLIRFYDDNRKWWWGVDAVLIDPHPNLNGTGIEEGFQGSEDDGSCDINLNRPNGQSRNSVFNFTEAPEILSVCGGTDPLDPDFCVCNQETSFICQLVATVDFVSQGTSFHLVPPTSQGVRKYTYVCNDIP